MLDFQHIEFLKRAVELARMGSKDSHGGPFGAVVVKDGVIIGEGFNQVTSSNDPSAHAEVVAIRDACNQLQNFQLNGCVIYASCEPCPMCLGAIYWARPDKVYYANTRHDAAEAGFDDAFIYEEIVLQPSQRKIPMLHLPLQDSKKVFYEWIENPDKKVY